MIASLAEVKELLRDELAGKLAALEELICGLGRVVVAYSGGVDSTFLLWAARHVLGGDAVLAVTARSPIRLPEEAARAQQLAAELGVGFRLVDCDELGDAQFVQNSPRRCYYCKRGMFGALRRLVGDSTPTAVLDGSNADDAADYRPGQEAAAEAGVLSPLAEVELTKSEIRQLSRVAGLPTWNQPADACLASRVPYGTPLCRELLQRLGAGESQLRAWGFRTVRLRHHGAIARLELDEEGLARLADPAQRQRVVGLVRQLGYLYVTADLEGYRTGSLNRLLTQGSSR